MNSWMYAVISWCSCFLNLSNFAHLFTDLTNLISALVF
jgi:hypothetical protein